MLTMPMSVLGAEPTAPAGDPSSGTSPLDGPEFWVAQYGTAAQANLQAVQSASSASPLDGPEFYAARVGTAAQAYLQAVQSASSASPLDGPKFYAAGVGTAPQAYLQTVQSANSASPLDGPEFYAARVGTAAQADLQAVQSANSTSPLDGPEFYAAQQSADLADCKTWSDALAQFHRVKPLSDPANGAWSPAQAQYFVAQYGMDGAQTVVHEENAKVFLCQADFGLLRP